MTIFCDPLPIAKEMLVHNIWALPPIPATRSFNVRFRYNAGENGQIEFPLSGADARILPCGASFALQCAY